MTLEDKTRQCLWTAHQLFERGRATGTTGNISFREGDWMYISASGACFGTLTAEEFCRLRIADGAVEGERKPSKEWPLHAALYRANERNQAVLHTHGFYTALWSCLEGLDPANAIPAYTPYLRMKAGAVRRVPYAPPGSRELFAQMDAACDADHSAYLLAHHGGLCAGANLMEAFGLMEELEESAHTAWCLRGEAGAARL